MNSAGWVRKASAWPLGPAIRSCALLRNRMLVDPAFLFKIGTEVGSTVCFQQYCALIDDCLRYGFDHVFCGICCR